MEEFVDDEIHKGHGPGDASSDRVDLVYYISLMSEYYLDHPTNLLSCYQFQLQRWRSLLNM